MKFHRNWYTLLRLAALLALLATTTAADDSDSVTVSIASSFDSTAIREVEPVRRSAGYHIVRLPQYAVQAPLKLVEGLGWFVVHDVYASKPIQKIIAALQIDKIWGVSPAFDYGREEGYGAGILFRSRDILTKGERFRAKALISTNDYQYYYLRYNLPHWRGYKYDINFNLKYHWQPRERFYGRGPATPEDHEVNYAHEETELQSAFSYFPRAGLGFGFDLRYNISNVRDGEDPGLKGDLDSLTQIGELSLTTQSFAPTRLFGAGFLFSHDWRNHWGQPTSGGIERLEVSYNTGTGRNDELEFWRLEAEVTHYVHIFMKRVVAVRGLVDWREALSGSPEIPVYLLAELGGVDGLRGFSSDRFLDNAKVLGQLEYRWPVWDRIDAFLFAEGGRVYDDFADEFTFKHWEISYGGGLRVWKEDGLIAFLQAGASDEGFRVYFKFSQDMDL